VKNVEALEVGRSRPGEEAAIIECMRHCFACRPTLEQWRHLFLANPAGESLILLARDGDTVVSHVAIVPRRFRIFGTEGVAGQSLDAMTHSAWQRTGLKTRLAIQAQQLAWRRGLLMIYGFSNEGALHGALKYEGRRTVRPLPLLVRPLRSVEAGRILARGWARRALGLRLPSGPGQDLPPDCATGGPLPADTSVSPAGRPHDGWTAPAFDERHTRLFREADAIPPIAAVRDATHLAWRYPAIPGSPYLQRDVPDGEALAATAVVRTATLLGLRFVFVMEWLWRPSARGGGLGLMRDVIRLARSADAHGVAVLAMPGTGPRRLLRRLGFLPIPGALLPKSTTLNLCPPTATAETRRWREPRHWYVTWGDGFIL
jgi:hypothetical protein